jgi:hypothetical protein
VDCDVAPLSACHLLLGRPWQFDLDATHGGRSNTYLFVHKGVHHVLNPMLESAIKAEIFATSKVKKKVAETTPKPRTALFREGGNDVDVPAPINTASIVDVPIITAANDTPKIQIVASHIGESNCISERSCHNFINTTGSSSGNSYMITSSVSNASKRCCVQSETPEKLEMSFRDTLKPKRG